MEGLPLKKIAPALYGVYTERLPLLLLPLAALLFKDQPALALGSLFLLYTWTNFGAGAMAVGWNDMVAKVIPLEKRGIFWGVTNTLGSGTGILGAVLAAWLLSRFDFPDGFVICFGLTGVFVAISWIFLAQTREVPQNSHKEKVSYLEYFRRLPAVLKEDPNFSNFLIAQVVMGLGGMLWGFLAVYAQKTWTMSDGQVGIYAIVMVVGQTLGNLFFGAFADRKGYKIVLELSALSAVISILIAVFAPGPGWLYPVFLLRGMSFAGFFMASLMVFEFTSPENRPTYIGLNSTIIGIGSSIAPLLGGLLAGWLDYRPMFIISLLFAAAGLVVLRVIVREPRHRAAAATGRAELPS